MVTITEPYMDYEKRIKDKIMKSLVAHTVLESPDNKDLYDDTYNDINTQGSELEKNQENDEIDYEEIDYYSIEGNYYYYLEVEEG